MKSAIKNIFYPSSICIAGASTKEKSIGYEILKSINNYGYNGKVFPINPRAETILEHRCYPAVSDIKEQIDLAIIVVPKIYVEDTIDELILKGVQTIILITAGFKEVGKEGEEIENKILTKVKKSGVRLIGPNCMGVINTLDKIKLNATFVAEKPEIGTTAFLSQSGAIGAAVLNSLRETDIKFAHFISVGNKADVSENDLLSFWNEDENIKIITMYLESFEEGEKFLLSFDEMNFMKPVIILKAGRTESGIKAASSHTGALGTSDNVVNAVLRQFGIIRAETLNELFNTAKGFEHFPLPNGNRVVIVTNAGGPAILAVDSLESSGLILSELSDSTKNKLKEIVHPEGSVQNPVDLLPGGNSHQYNSVIKILTEDKNVDSVISIFVEPVMVSPFDVIESVNSINSEKPILQVVMPLPEFWNFYRKNSVYKKPLFRNPEDPAKVLSNVLFYAQKKERKKRLKPVSSKIEVKKGKGFLPNNEINQLVKTYDFPVIESIQCTSEKIIEAASEIGYPVVVKAVSGKIIHKSDLNAVVVNIKNDDELLSAIKGINENLSKHNLSVKEFLVQKYAKAKHELLIGGFRDRSFGPIIMFGSGGKYVEVINDVAIKSAYLCDEDIDEMIEETKIGKILKGVRGENSIDLFQLKRIIKLSAQLLLENVNITEFDFNPVIISEMNELYAVDIRIKS